ncbi:hypothetical protein [Actinopolymorpha pittospori]|uniref:Uncharacterized protein n=1 Tax=Actinopolymorpha pittospori TaxID=648752 RepID=A0A927N1J0_9ACTN|nr:hypothetical protein [Actinopolymorpha pittospori]MBE1609233.1 hypothetical protein [Actinopolymorpha pittospori]
MTPFKEARERLERALSDRDAPVHDAVSADGRDIADALRPSSATRQSEQQRAQTLQRMLLEAQRLESAPRAEVPTTPNAEVGGLQHEVEVDTPDGPVRIRHVEALSDEEARRVAERAADAARRTRRAHRS